jgi:hypothetical protein
MCQTDGWLQSPVLVVYSDGKMTCAHAERGRITEHARVVTGGKPRYVYGGAREPNATSTWVRMPVRTRGTDDE